MTEPKSVVLPLHHGSMLEWAAKIRLADFFAKWILGSFPGQINLFPGVKYKKSAR